MRVEFLFAWGQLVWSAIGVVATIVFSSLLWRTERRLIDLEESREAERQEVRSVQRIAASNHFLEYCAEVGSKLRDGTYSTIELDRDRLPLLADLELAFDLQVISTGLKRYSDWHQSNSPIAFHADGRAQVDTELPSQGKVFRDTLIKQVESTEAKLGEIIRAFSSNESWIGP